MPPTLRSHSSRVYCAVLVRFCSPVNTRHQSLTPFEIIFIGEKGAHFRNAFLNGHVTITRAMTPPPLAPAVGVDMNDEEPRSTNVASPFAKATEMSVPALNFSPLHTLSSSPLDIMEDEDVRARARGWVRLHACPKGKPPKKAKDFRRWVNTVLIPEDMNGHEPISTRTAHRWLNLLGFHKTEHRKGM